MAALGGASSTSPDTVKGKPLPSLYSKDISSFCVCLSSHSVTAPVMTEIFKRKYGNSAGKLGDWIYQRSLTQFIPPRVGWDCRNISCQPPANRDHPPWSLEAVSPFLPSSLPPSSPPRQGSLGAVLPDICELLLPLITSLLTTHWAPGAAHTISSDIH